MREIGARVVLVFDQHESPVEDGGVSIPKVILQDARLTPRSAPITIPASLEMLWYLWIQGTFYLARGLKESSRR